MYDWLLCIFLAEHLLFIGHPISTIIIERKLPTKTSPIRRKYKASTQPSQTSTSTATTAAAALRPTDRHERKEKNEQAFSQFCWVSLHLPQKSTTLQSQVVLVGLLLTNFLYTDTYYMHYFKLSGTILVTTTTTAQQ